MKKRDVEREKKKIKDKWRVLNREIGKDKEREER